MLKSKLVLVFVMGLFAVNIPSAMALAVVESRTGDPVIRSSTEETPYQGVSSQPGGNAVGNDRASRLNLNQIEALKQEISELRGLVEVQDHEIKQLKKSQQDLYVDLDKRLSQAQQNQKPISVSNSKDIQTGPKGKKPSVVVTSKAEMTPKTEATPKVEAAPKIEGKTETKAIAKAEPKVSKPVAVLSTEPTSDPLETGPADEPVTVTSKATKKASASAVTIVPTGTMTEPGMVNPIASNTNEASEKNAYEAAYNLVRSKQYADAVIAFQKYLSQYPQGERAPTAHYWLGEVYMVQWQSEKSNTGLLDKASQSFSTITLQFPSNNKVPDALLKLGLIENEKGNIEEARRYWMEAKTKHSGTAAARIADTRLQQLKK